MATTPPTTLNKPLIVTKPTGLDTNGVTKKVVINLGKQKRSRVKALRKGEGVLMEDVDREIARLREAAVLKADGPVVILLVRQKERRTPTLW